MDERKESEYLKNYDITKYERPSVAADIAIFTVMEDRNANYRKLAVKKLKMLLIKRGVPPFEGLWALPGGFVRKGETIEDAAYRELREETGVNQSYLKEIGVFSQPGRDPRGWIISDAFMALTDASHLKVRGSDDAKEAAWFNVTLESIDGEKQSEQSHLSAEHRYKLCLTSEDVRLCAILSEKVQMEDYHKKSEIAIIESNGLAFDHAKIILSSIRQLRHLTEEGNMAFDLLPEYFTLTDLQNVYEIILDKELLKANFRRKIMHLVLPTEQMVEGAGHRPAQLFFRNLENFF